MLGWLRPVIAARRILRVQRPVQRRFFSSQRTSSVEDEYKMGMSALGDGNARAALQFFDRAQQLSPQSTAVLLPKAHALRMLGRTSEAIDLLRHVVSIAPTSAEAKLQLAEALLASNDSPSEIEVILQEAIQLFEHSNPDQVNVRARHRLSQLLFESGRLNEARSLLEECVKKGGETNSTILANLGALHLSEGNLPEAYRLLSKSMLLSPNSTTAYNLANVCFELNKLDEADQNFKIALEDSDDSQLHLNYGLLLERMNRFDEAEEHLSIAVLSTADHLPKDLRSQGLISLIIIRRKLGKPGAAAAVEALRKLKSFQPAELEVHLGNACFSAKLLDEARSHYEAALQLDQDDAIANLNLGLLLYQFLGNTESGLAHMELAVELDPSLAEHLKAITTKDKPNRARQLHVHEHHDSHAHGHKCGHKHHHDHQCSHGQHKQQKHAHQCSDGADCDHKHQH